MRKYLIKKEKNGSSKLNHGKRRVLIHPYTSLAEIARLMVELDCGEIPLVENSKVAGVITDRDIVCRTLGVGKNPFILVFE